MQRTLYIFLLVTLIGSGEAARAQAPQSDAAAKTADERLTPRSSFFGYLDACKDGDYRRAASYLNLERSRNKAADGPELAQELKDILDRKLRADPGRLNNSPEGDVTDGLDPDYDLLGAIRVKGQSEDLLLERVKRENVQIWLISASTVRMIPTIHASLGTTWAEGHLPQWMMVTGPLDTAVWQWMALVVAIFLAGGLSALFARIAIAILRPVLARTTTTLDDLLIDTIVRPIQLILSLFLFHASVVFISPPLVVRHYLTLILTGVFFYAMAWLVLRIIDVVAAQVVVRMGSRQRASATSVVPLGRRTAKAGVVILAILAALNGWGFNTTSILAGLGVGGLAVALAAQKTIENLFGGVSLTTDRPILVGDYCRYGDHYGIVEDIGLRSTRLRTLDRTLVTVPNSTFSSMEIENFGRRDKVFFHPTIKLRLDTTPEQIRTLIARFREILLEQKQAEADPARVRFVGIGQYSIDIEIFTYFKTTDFDGFLITQEEILLAILDAVHEVGTGIAIPSQLNVLSRDLVAPGRRERSSLLPPDAPVS